MHFKICVLVEENINVVKSTLDSPRLGKVSKFGPSLPLKTMKAKKELVFTHDYFRLPREHRTKWSSCGVRRN